MFSQGLGWFLGPTWGTGCTPVGPLVQEEPIITAKLHLKEHMGVLYKHIAEKGGKVRFLEMGIIHLGFGTRRHF